MRFDRRAMFLGLFCSLSVFAGCEDGPKPKDIATVPGHDHEHGHEHEHTYESVKDAVEELVALRNTIRDSFARTIQIRLMTRFMKWDTFWKPFLSRPTRTILVPRKSLRSRHPVMF